MNIFICHNTPQLAYSSLSLGLLADRIQENDISIYLWNTEEYYRLYFKNGEKNWDVIDESQFNQISFNLTLWHGSDFNKTPKKYSPLLLFGGSPERYKELYGNQQIINERISTSSSFSMNHWKKLFDFIESGNPPTFLYVPSIVFQKQLIEAYQSRLANFDFLSISCANKKIALVCNTLMEIHLIDETVASWYTVIKESSYQNLLNVFSEKEDAFDIIIIPAELDFAKGNIELQAIQGAVLVQDLRLNRIKCTIVLFSPFLSEAEINRRDRYEVLNVPGQYFFNLPEQVKEMKDCVKIAEPISERLLDEVNYYHFNKEGKFREIIHDLITDLRNHRREEVGSLTTQCFKNLHFFFKTEFDNHLKEINSIKAEIDGKLSGNSIDSFHRNNFSNEIERLRQLLMPASCHVVPLEKQKTKWKVLFLEDMDFDRSEVCKAMEEAGIQYIATNSSIAALKMIREDVSKEIKVIVSDWRLKEKGSKKWQPFQGLDVIEKIVYEEKHHAAFFILTDRQGGILDEIIKQQSIPIRWYTKAAVIDNDKGMGKMINHILQEGKFLYDAIYNKPKGKAWYNTRKGHLVAPLREYYLAFQSPEMHYWKNSVFHLAENILIEMKQFSKIVSEKYKLNYMQKILEEPEDMIRDLDEKGHGAFRFLNKMTGRLVYLTLRQDGKSQQESVKLMEVPCEKTSQLLWHLAIKEKVAGGLYTNALEEESVWINRFLNEDYTSSLSSLINDSFQYVKSTKTGKTEYTEKIDDLNYLAQLQWLFQLSPQALGSSIIKESIKKLKRDIKNNLAKARTNTSLSEEEKDFFLKVDQILTQNK